MGTETGGCEHVWQLDEVVVSARGADQVAVCPRCGLLGFQAGQAALQDTRPPLGPAV